MIVNEITRAELRKLGRQGRLVDAAFKAFQRKVYPGAVPDHVAALHIAFFAGAAEVHTILMVSLDPGEEPTDGDMDMYSGIASEIETFHARTIATMNAGVGGKPDA